MKIRILIIVFFVSSALGLSILGGNTDDLGSSLEEEEGVETEHRKASESFLNFMKRIKKGIVITKNSNSSLPPLLQKFYPYPSIPNFPITTNIQVDNNNFPTPAPSNPAATTPQAIFMDSIDGAKSSFIPSFPSPASTRFPLALWGTLSPQMQISALQKFLMSSKFTISKEDHAKLLEMFRVSSAAGGWSQEQMRLYVQLLNQAISRQFFNQILINDPVPINEKFQWPFTQPEATRLPSRPISIDYVSQPVPPPTWITSTPTSPIWFQEKGTSWNPAQDQAYMRVWYANQQGLGFNQWLKIHFGIDRALPDIPVTITTFPVGVTEETPVIVRPPVMDPPIVIPQILNPPIVSPPIVSPQLPVLPNEGVMKVQVTGDENRFLTQQLWSLLNVNRPSNNGNNWFNGYPYPVAFQQPMGNLVETGLSLQDWFNTNGHLFINPTQPGFSNPVPTITPQQYQYLITIWTRYGSGMDFNDWFRRYGWAYIREADPSYPKIITTIPPPSAGMTWEAFYRIPGVAQSRWVLRTLASQGNAAAEKIDDIYRRWLSRNFDGRLTAFLEFINTMYVQASDFKITSDTKPKCGQRSPPAAGRLSTGATVSHPWMVLIKQGGLNNQLGGVTCSGLLVSSTAVLTSESCTKRFSPTEDVSFLFGSKNADFNDRNGKQVQTFRTTNQILKQHPSLNLVLIQLPEPVVFDSNVAQVCLPQRSAALGEDDYYVVGWDLGLGDTQSVLKQSLVNMLEPKFCEKRQHDRKKHICIGQHDEIGFAACGLNYGEPLLHRNRMSQYSVVGIIDHESDPDCVDKFTTGSFTSIDGSVSKWILENATDSVVADY